MTTKPKGLLRVMSILLGLFGIGWLLVAFAMALVVVADLIHPEHRDVPSAIFMLVMLFLAFATALYFLRVGYLGWFKLSPTAVEYVCGTWWFFIWCATLNLFFTPQARTAPSVGTALLGFLVSAGIYYAYRASTNYFTKKIFFAPNAQA